MQQYNDVAQDVNGNAVDGASVTVYLKGTTTKATIYSDDGSTGKSNPFTTSSDGRIQFYAGNGEYDVTVTASGYDSKTNEIILHDPNDGEAAFDWDA